MNGNSVKFSVVAMLWTVAFGVGVAGTIDDDPVMRFWALMIALVASLVTAHLIMTQAVHAERIRVERLVEGLIAEANARAVADLPKVR